MYLEPEQPAVVLEVSEDMASKVHMMLGPVAFALAALAQEDVRVVRSHEGVDDGEEEEEEEVEVVGAEAEF